MAESRRDPNPDAAVRATLGEEGLLLRLRTTREDDVLTAKVELERAEGSRSLLKLAVSVRLEDLDLTLGVDASEEELERLSRRLRDLWEALRGRIPVEVTREE